MFEHTRKLKKGIDKVIWMCMGLVGGGICQGIYVAPGGFYLLKDGHHLVIFYP